LDEGFSLHHPYLSRNICKPPSIHIEHARIQEKTRPTVKNSEYFSFGLIFSTMGLKESAILALFGSVFGLLISSGLATDFPRFPEPDVFFIAIITIIGSAIGWYIGGYKLGMQTS